MPPRALLFDFDGVIADTENIHIAAWERTLGMLALDVPPEVCARAAEEDDRLFLRRIFEQKSIEKGNVKGWVGRKQELTRQLLADSPRVYPGVVKLVERVYDLARLAVVTTTWRENVKAVLEASGLADRFDLVIAKENVRTPKPDPEAYLTAIRRLRLKSPTDAIALEDSPTGLASARAAGIPCLAVGHRRGPGTWYGDAPFVEDLSDTEAVLRALGFDGSKPVRAPRRRRKPDQKSDKSDST